MTPAQQQALAKQYGINLPQTQASSGSGDSQRTGESLEQASSDDLSADKETQPDDLAGAVDQRCLDTGVRFLIKRYHLRTNR